MLVRPRNTEKTSAVLESRRVDNEHRESAGYRIAASPGHGRNGAEAFGGARKVDITHQELTHGDRCPECGKGNVYGQKEPKALVQDCGAGAAGGYGLLAGAVALRRLRAGVHGTRAGRSGRRKSTTRPRRR